MKNLLNLGKALTKAQQKQINGGHDNSCGIYSGPTLCPPGGWCCDPDTYLCISHHPGNGNMCW